MQAVPGDGRAGVVEERVGLVAELAGAIHAAGRPAFLLAPYAELPVPQALLDLGVPGRTGILGLGRLLDPWAARETLGPAAEGLGDGELLSALLPGAEVAAPRSPFAALFAWGLDSI